MHGSSGEVVNLQLGSFDIPTHFLGFCESVSIFIFIFFILFVSAHFVGQ